jgi:pyruvate dehydrogenase E1 component
VRRLGEPDGEAMYLRLSTRPIDQRPFAELSARVDADELRGDVLAGGYRLVEPSVPGGDAHVVLAGCGAVVPELVHAAAALEAEGVAATVLDLTSPDRLYRRGVVRCSSRPAAPAVRSSSRCTSRRSSRRRSAPRRS